MTEDAKEGQSGSLNKNATTQLKSFVERIERLEEEKKALSDDITDVFGEAKASGFDVKALRAIIRLRKIEAAEREEQQAILDTYMHALGMLADLPLGAAAIAGAAKERKGRGKAKAEENEGAEAPLR